MSKNVQIRLSDEAWNRYSGAAMAHGRTLAGHLKQVLEVEHLRMTIAIESMAEDIAALREATERGGPAGTDAMQAETLLLLRQIAGPDRQRVAQAEIERQELKVWRGTDA